MHGAAKTARVQECYDHVGNLAETARKHRVALSFVRKVTRAGFKHQAYKRISHKATPIRKRRSILERLRKTVSIKEHRKWAKFGTATKMRDQLLKKHKIRVSVSTVRRDLRTMGCRCRVRKATPSCRRGDLAAVKSFKQRVKREKIQGKNLVSTDESYVTTHERTGRLQWMKPGERTHPMENNHKYSASRVMVWGAIGQDYKSELVVFPTTMLKRETPKETEERLAKKKACERRRKTVAYRMNGPEYIKLCLTPLLPHFHKNPHLVLLQDGATSHWSELVTKWLKDNNVPTLKGMPAYSPQFNPIEPVWNTLKDRMGEACPLYPGPLRKSVVETWDKMDMKTVNGHVRKFDSECAKP
jgi:transposase